MLFAPPCVLSIPCCRSRKCRPWSRSSPSGSIATLQHRTHLQLWIRRGASGCPWNPFSDRLLRRLARSRDGHSHDARLSALRHRGLVLESGAKLAAIGCVLGLTGAAAASGLLCSMLFGVSLFDPLVLLLAAMCVLLLAVGASVPLRCGRWILAL
jgi:hypothetical protein